MYKYRVVNNTRIRLNVGAGIGYMSFSQTYPMEYQNGSGPFQNGGGGDLCFPVQLDLHYAIRKRLLLGFSGGFYIEPDYPVLGYHAGPRIAYVIN